MSVLKPKTVGDFAVPKLVRIVQSLTLSAAAEFLGVDRSQLSRCTKGREAISPELARRIANVDFFLDRASHLLWPDEIGPWLTSPEPLLGGSVPLSVLILSGAAQVVGALEARVGGAFA
ncbi:MAG: helix-turn-helix domain-containing protein [Candidatus Eremiobacteraeota bacterium]|nr:helix-turn-helix domain-containing protein [Candidatus Eremiobacteraeota bacterium]